MFVREKLYNQMGGTLLRRYRDGEAKYEGTLDDYAFFIRALLELYQADFDSFWLEWAVQLQQKQDELFWDTQNGGYFYTPESPAVPLIVRTKDFMDSAMPSPNNASTINLLLLDLLVMDEETKYREQAIKNVHAAGAIVIRAHRAFHLLLCAVDMLTDINIQVAIISPTGRDQASEFLAVVNHTFLPNGVVGLKEEGKGESQYKVGMLEGKRSIGGKVTAIVCDSQGKICRAPVHEPAALAQELKSTIKTYAL